MFRKVRLYHYVRCSGQRQNVCAFACLLMVLSLIFFLCQQPSSASKIIALVPKEHAPSDASEISDFETELLDARTNSSTPLSTLAPSIASSLANLTIDTSDEELNSEDANIIPDSIVREMGNSIYENVSSLSAIPSLPATPITPTRSRKPPTVKAKIRKNANKFQLTY